MNLKIYTVHHFIPEWYLSNDVFIPFIVDAWKYPERREPFCYDDNLPPEFSIHSFAEMRCHYWVWWTPAPRFDYVGFFHYRRKLMTWQPDPETPSKKGTLAEFKDAPIDLETQILNEQCEKYDIILPRPWFVKPNVGADYCRSHGEINWQVLLHTLPDRNMAKVGNLLYPCNIFIMRSNIFAEYMTWWVTIMLKLIRVISPPPPPEYQSRTFGFISDRMFTIWLKHQRELHPEWRILELPMLIGDFSSI